MAGDSDRSELSLSEEVVESCVGLSRMELARTSVQAAGLEEAQRTLESAGAAGVSRASGRRRSPRADKRPASRSGQEPEYRTPSVASRSSRSKTSWATCSRWCWKWCGVPFGAHLRYRVYASTPAQVVGCVQLSSPAWRMAARDAWIGWDDATRSRSLQRVVNNSRFLLLPWVPVQHLEHDAELFRRRAS